MSSKGFQFASLVVDSTRACKSASKALARTDTRDDTTRSHTLDGVVAIPGHQVIVVDDDLLGFVFKLYISFNISVPESGCRLTSRGNTYLMLNDSTKALDPKKAIATEGVDEEALA